MLSIVGKFQISFSNLAPGPRLFPSNNYPWQPCPSAGLPLRYQLQLHSLFFFFNLRRIFGTFSLASFETSNVLNSVFFPTFSCSVAEKYLGAPTSRNQNYRLNKSVGAYMCPSLCIVMTKNRFFQEKSFFSLTFKT